MDAPSPRVRPLLQVALDMTDLRDAVQVAEAVGDEVDILEAGTVLIASAGMEAVRALKTVAEGRLVLADLRIVRAGAALTRLAVDAGADVIVAMGAAPDAVIGAAVREAGRAGAAVQVEPEADWTERDLRRWAELGIGQVMHHRIVEADEAGEPIDDSDRRLVEALAGSGMAVTVTGGLSRIDVEMMVGWGVSAVAVGRAIAAAPDPGTAARGFRKAIESGACASPD